MNIQNYRGDGTTTRQMTDAPRGAFYICVDPRLGGYFFDLSMKLGRSDLKLRSPEWLENGGSRGLRADFVVDHATTLTKSQWQRLCALRPLTASEPTP